MQNSKLIAAAAVAISMVAGIGSAFAADIAPRYAKSPMMADPSYNWTGFYIGVAGGYGEYHASSQNVGNPGGAFINTNPSSRGEGAVVRFFAGYDYQFASSWLVGVLADGDWLDIGGRAQNSLAGGFGSPANARLSERWAWAVGGRLGYLVNPQLLAYANGGYTESEFGGSDFTFANFPFGPAPTTRPARTYEGYFVGGGIEYAFAPGWSAKAEYRFADYRGTNELFFTGGGSFGVSERTHSTVQTITAGISYKFN